MKTNFEIENNSAIRHNGKLFDLHNNFDMIGYQYDNQTRELKIKWTKTDGDWVKTDEATELEITHSAVSFLTITDRDKNSSIADDQCLSELTFFPSDCREINDSVGAQPSPADKDDLLYFFENGQLIRICCETVKLKYR